jgi:hypothetical protein
VSGSSSPSPIEGEIIIVDDPQLGRVAHVLPTIPDGAPSPIAEGIARRRIAAITGECPCGARRVLPNRAARRRAKRDGEALRSFVVFAHEEDCSADTETLIRMTRLWLEFDFDLSG